MKAYLELAVTKLLKPYANQLTKLTLGFVWNDYVLNPNCAWFYISPVLMYAFTANFHAWHCFCAGLEIKVCLKGHICATISLCSPLGSLSGDPSPFALPPVILRIQVNMESTRHPGEVLGKGGTSLCSISVLGRVERPQKGLGLSLSLLLNGRKLIGISLHSRMHDSERGC